MREWVTKMYFLFVSVMSCVSRALPRHSVMFASRNGWLWVTHSKSNQTTSTLRIQCDRQVVHTFLLQQGKAAALHARLKALQRPVCKVKLQCALTLVFNTILSFCLVCELTSLCPCLTLQINDEKDFLGKLSILVQKETRFPFRYSHTNLVVKTTILSKNRRCLFCSLNPFLSG